MVSNDYDEDKVQRVLDKFMESLPADQKKDFGRLYFDKVLVLSLSLKTAKKEQEAPDLGDFSPGDSELLEVSITAEKNHQGLWDPLKNNSP